MIKYILVFFDYKSDAFGANEQLIKATIQNLWNGIYKNRSLKISPNTLLVRLFDSDLISYPYPKECVEDVFNEEYQKTEGIAYDLSSIYTYVLPVEIEDIVIQLRGFEREIELFNGLEER